MVRRCTGQRKSAAERTPPHHEGFRAHNRRNSMDIHLAGSRPTRRAPKEWFTGTVLQDPIVAAQAPARLVANRVAFEPCTRTNWHTPPLGQRLYVNSFARPAQRLRGWRQAAPALALRRLD